MLEHEATTRGVGRHPGPRRRLNHVLIVGIADALLLLVLFYVAFVDRNDAAVSVIGPLHGFGFIGLLWLTAKGAGDGDWGWWFPAAVLVTGGPIGSLIGDIVLRRRLSAASAA